MVAVALIVKAVTIEVGGHYNRECDLLRLARQVENAQQGFVAVLAGKAQQVVAYVDQRQIAIKQRGVLAAKCQQLACGIER